MKARIILSISAAIICTGVAFSAFARFLDNHQLLDLVLFFLFYVGLLVSSMTLFPRKKQKSCQTK